MTLAVLATTMAMLAVACGGTGNSGTGNGRAASTSSTAGGAGSDSAPGAPVEPLAEIRITHPQTIAFGAPLAFAEDSKALAAVARTVSVGTWATPDVLRSTLVNGQVEAAAVPTYVGANLFNKDVDVRMVAVVVWGLLWLIGPDGSAGDWDALKGQTVMVPFRNDMPDLIFQYLARANGLEPGKDFTIEHVAQPPDAVAPLIQGTRKWAVLPEHLATIALTQANKAGRELTRALDMQKEWSKAANSSEQIPQAGIVMPGKLVDGRPDVVAALLDALDESVARVDKADAPTVKALAEANGLDESMVRDLIPRLNLKVVPGADARKSLERFFTELAKTSPDLIGGKLPAARFYVKDPR